jgi:hypothetical protein
MFSRVFTPSPLGYPEDLAGEVLGRLRDLYEPVSVRLEDEVNDESGYFTYYRLRDRSRTEVGP